MLKKSAYLLKVILPTYVIHKVIINVFDLEHFSFDGFTWQGLVIDFALWLAISAIISFLMEKIDKSERLLERFK